MKKEVANAEAASNAILELERAEKETAQVGAYPLQPIFYSTCSCKSICRPCLASFADASGLHQSAPQHHVCQPSACVDAQTPWLDVQRATEMAGVALAAEKKLVEAMKQEAAAAAELLDAERAAKFAAQVGSMCSSEHCMHYRSRTYMSVLWPC